jgi:hypothetical protein
MPIEPLDVGPLFGGDQPALESDRQLVLNLLNAAYADERLGLSDFSARTERVWRARTFDDLVPLVRDLMAARG